MRIHLRLLGVVVLGVGVALLIAWPQPAPAYIGGPPLSLGLMCAWSTHAAPTAHG